MIWTLGRLGQRVPLHGPLNTVVPVKYAVKWLEMIQVHPGDDFISNVAVMQLSRRTNDRHRDVDVALRERVVNWLSRRGAAEHLMELVRSGGSLNEGEQGVVYGESMPIGLRLNQ
jgi:hypothetical protein